MNRTDIDNIFNRRFNGHRNMLTPVIVRRGKAGDFLYEISRAEAGDRMMGDSHGVTVLTLDGSRPEQDLSRLCENRAAAEEYVRQLRGLSRGQATLLA